MEICPQKWTSEFRTAESIVEKMIYLLKDEKMSLNKVAKIFKIDRKMLKNKIANYYRGFEHDSGKIPTYLNPSEVTLPRRKIVEKEANFQCLTVSEIRQLASCPLEYSHACVNIFHNQAYELRDKREKNAMAKIQLLFQHTPPAYSLPSRAWLLDVAKRQKVRLVVESWLERERSTNASIEVIKQWVTTVWKSAIEGVPPEFIINFDEIMVDCSRRKLLVGVRETSKIGYTTPAAFPDHITMVPAISAFGASLGNFIILNRERLQQFPEFCKAFPDFHIVGNKSGWMTSATYECFVAHLVKAIERLRKEENYSGKVVFVCDNHSTRANKERLEELARARIELVTIPSHTSHILQPIDQVFGHAFKAAFRKQADLAQKATFFTQPISVREANLQKQLLALMTAYQQCATFGVCRASWKRANIWPLDEDSIYNSPKVRKGQDDSSLVVHNKRIKLSFQGGELNRDMLPAIEAQENASAVSITSENLADNGVNEESEGNLLMEMYTTAKYPGLKVVGREESEVGDGVYSIKWRTGGETRVVTAKGSQLSRTIKRNYHRTLGNLQ